MIRRLLARLRAERGQALILFVGIFSIIMLAGAITVDFGIWMGERRGAQTDADLSSLAGAQEYVKYLAQCSGSTPYPGGQSGADAAAVAAANTWFGDNNESGNASLPSVTPANPWPQSAPCGAPTPSCLTVTVKHDTRALFTSLFPGVGPGDHIGTHAKACAGALSGTSGSVPIEMASTNDPCFTNGQPNYAALCLLESGSGGCGGGAGAGFGRLAPPPTRTPGPTRTPRRTATPTRTPTSTPTLGPPTPTPTPGTPPCNPHGILDLDAPGDYCSDSGGGSNTLADLIANGATGTCKINAGNTCDPTHNGPWYDCVAVQTGNSQQVINGFVERLTPARQDPCDTSGNGVAEFTETVSIVVDTGDPRTSLYEARVCSNGEISSRIITIIILDTNPPAGNDGHPIRGFAAFYFAGCYDDRNPSPTDVSQLDVNCTTGIPPGHTAIYGQFVKLTVSGGEVGPPDPSSTLFGIHLTQ